jgi:hypothetical protein
MLAITIEELGVYLVIDGIGCSTLAEEPAIVTNKIPLQ